jgi:hypothetical protein
MATTGTYQGGEQIVVDTFASAAKSAQSGGRW